MENLLQFLASDWAWINTVAAVAGAIFVWLIARWKSMTEIRVLKAELAARNVNLFEKMIALDEKQREIVRSLYESLRTMSEAEKEGDAAAACQHRAEAIKTFLLDYIGSYYHYTGLGKWIYQDNKAELIDDELMPFLETSAAVLNALNKESLLQLTGSRALKIQDYDLQFALRFIQRNTRFWNWKRKRGLDKELKRIFG